jgi:protein-tyrosine phosphatase
VDDGATDIETALQMAKIAVNDGIQAIACTPHIMPGVYNNRGPDIRTGVAALQAAIDKEGLRLRLTFGADVHVAPDLPAHFKDGSVLTLHDTRYFLFEPPHHIIPPRLEEHVFNLLAAGFVPILTHPERLTWIERAYELIGNLAHGGMLIQVTAGSLTGLFGRRPKYWAERILDERLCHILATDAHDPERRPPVLSKARDMAAERLGSDEATNLVWNRPLGILNNLPTMELPIIPEASSTTPGEAGGFFRLVRRLLPI